MIINIYKGINHQLVLLISIKLNKDYSLIPNSSSRNVEFNSSFIELDISSQLFLQHNSPKFTFISVLQTKDIQYLFVS